MLARLKSVPVWAVAVLLGVLVTAQERVPRRVEGPVPSKSRDRAASRSCSWATRPRSTTRRRFAPMLKAALAQYGFNFSYTTDPADLNAANLAQYDALMIYANHETIAPDQEKALLDFVAGGKGFLPIHSASFCFQNSPAYIALVGAQFQRHGTGRVHDDVREHRRIR